MKTFLPRRNAQAFCARGFTLVELVIVMVLLVLMSGAAATSMKGLTSSQENVAATRVRSALIYAQQVAMGGGLPTYAVIDSVSDKVWFYVENDKKPGKKNREPLKDPVSLASMVIDLGGDGTGIVSVKISSSNEIKFNADGTPADGNGKALKADALIKLNGGVKISIVKSTGLVVVK